MAFKEEGTGFSDRSCFTNEMARLESEEAVFLVEDEDAKKKEEERRTAEAEAYLAKKEAAQANGSQKNEAKKEEARARKKQAARLNAVNFFKAKKKIESELGGSEAVTGDAFRDGASGLAGTVLETINPLHYLKKALIKLGAVAAPCVVIFAMISIFIVIIFAVLFDILSPIARVSDGIQSIISIFSGDYTFVNAPLDEDTIDAIVEGSGCNATQEVVIRFALSRVGYPYSQDLRTSGYCYDCSSLAYYSWAAAWVDLSGGGGYPPTAAEEARIMEKKGKALDQNNISDLQPGDLIFYGGDTNKRYKGIYHVAIYVGNGKVVEALNTKYGVVYENVRTKNAIMVVRPG